MKLTSPGMLLLFTLMAASPVALAQKAMPATCGTQETGLAPELATWTSKQTVKAVAAQSNVPAAELKIGQSYTASLKPMSEIEFLSPPEKTGAPEASGGLFEIIVSEPGTYAIALGTGAWVDVIANGAPVVSTAHGHGPECSTIRKTVDFPLKRGRHIVQVAGSPETDISIMVARR